MSKDELMQKLIDKVKEKYRPLLGKTKDAVKEDQLRQQARQEMEAIRKGYYEFNGRSSNWDVSFLKGEYTQGNDEAMIAAQGPELAELLLLHRRQIVEVVQGVRRLGVPGR